MPHTIFASVVLAAIASSSVAAALLPLPQGAERFNSPGFVVRHAWVKFAWAGVRPLRGEMSTAEEGARVARFFELNQEIVRQERIAGDPATDLASAAAAKHEDAALRDERDGIKNSVERILEGRLTHVVKEAGLTRHIGADIVWPPVSIEFQEPPAVLVKSPRSVIRKDSETLLDGQLPAERVQRIEADAERDGGTSALVVSIGGIAMYPAIIPPDADYHFVLQDIAHEWTHHYLFFAPLGRAYFSSPELTTLNETVADFMGRELGDRLLAEYPLEHRTAYVSGGPAFDTREDSGQSTDIDVTSELRNLRRQVEALLADGKIDEAERLMEEKREFLAANGYYIRRLNQAYFAFHGSYADSPGSIDPIGPKLDALRNKSASLKDFVLTARQLTSRDDLDQALASR